MKTILITGASRGIGLELANQYTAAGWRVIGCLRNPHKNPKLQTTLQIKLDVRNDADIQNLAKMEESIDILINNAGISGAENEELTTSNWLELLHINTVAPYWIAKTLLPHMKRDGLIVNMSSIYGSIEKNTELNNFVGYRTSKSALNAITKCLANELKEKGVNVISLHPGSVRTDMNTTGKISAAESASGIRQVLANVKETGIFLDYQGKPLPW